MFFVFNRQKIYSYLVAMSTIIVLFFIAAHMNKTNVVQTAGELNKELPIYNIETDENKVALTMNCAWNADDIDHILQILEKANVKITFFMVGDFVEKYPEAVKKINDAGHEIRKSFLFSSACK